MYRPDHFKEDRVPALHEAIRAIGLGTLVTCGGDGMEASHVPMLIESEPAPCGTLAGHLARANPQWQRAGAGMEALAIFLGPDAYVTPSWYPSKRESGEVVPTWNYVAVHAYGRLEFLRDPAATLAHLRKLTAHHESARPVPWAVSDAPADYIARMVEGVVAFRLVVTRLEGKWKMSQNRSPEDRAGAREGLRREGGAARQDVAEIMAKLTAPGGSRPAR